MIQKKKTEKKMNKTSLNCGTTYVANTCVT